MRTGWSVDHPGETFFYSGWSREDRIAGILNGWHFSSVLYSSCWKSKPLPTKAWPWSHFPPELPRLPEGRQLDPINHRLAVDHRFKNWAIFQSTDRASDATESAAWSSIMIQSRGADRGDTWSRQERPHNRTMHNRKWHWRSCMQRVCKNANCRHFCSHEHAPSSKHCHNYHARLPPKIWEHWPARSSSTRVRELWGEVFPSGD